MMKLTFISLALFALFLFTAACSSTPTRTVLVSPLDGVWLLSDLQCSGGPLTKGGKEDRNDIKSGLYRNLVIVTGDEVNGFIYELPDHPEKYPDSRCEIRLREQWMVDSIKSTVTISGTEAHSFAVNISLKSKGCLDSFNIEKPRTHQFTLKDNQLFLTLSEGFSTNGEQSKPACDSGSEVISYKRVF